MKLSNFSIGFRIYAGFSTLVLLCLGLAGLGLNQMNEVGIRVGEMTVLADKSRTIEAVRLDLEAIRRAETRYNLDSSESAAQEVRGNTVKIDAILLKNAQTVVSAERQRMYQGVRQTLQTHAANFADLVALSEKSFNARTRLFADEARLSTAIAKLVAARGEPVQIASVGEIVSNIGALRLAALRFVGIPEPSGSDLVASNLAKTRRALDLLATTADATMIGPMTDLRDVLSSYEQSFNDFETSKLASLSLYDATMQPQIQQMQQQLGTAASSLMQSADKSRDIVFGLMTTASRLCELLGGAALVFGVALAAIIGRSITRPIAGMTLAMGKLADGDTMIDIPARESRDEVGDMSRAVVVFKEKLAAAARLSATQVAAREDRSRRQDEMERETQNFGNIIGAALQRMSGLSDDMRLAAETMTDSSTKVHEQASATSQVATQSSSDLTAAASAVEELTSSFAEIAHQVAGAADSSREAVQRAEASQESIRGLVESTGRIGDVVRLISDIARQTNLLALNATIEAARAGDAGKGFAVVAGEVKALAAHTAKATSEISGQIDNVRSAADSAIQTMNEIGGTIGRMEEVSTAIAAAVEQQSVATREIASSIHMVTGATAQSTGSMVQVVASADQAGLASQQVLVSTAAIGDEASTLRTEINRFLAAVRADSSDRRRFERLTTNRVTATLHRNGQPPVRVLLRDLSEGGAAIQCEQFIAIGTEITIDLPDAGGPVVGCVMRIEKDLLGINFREDQAVRMNAKRAMQALSDWKDAA